MTHERAIYILKNTAWLGTANDLAEVEMAIKTLEDIEPIRIGHWISKNLDHFRKYEVVCSNCSARYVGNYDSYDEPYDFNYCPYCGSKMEEQDDDHQGTGI